MPCTSPGPCKPSAQGTSATILFTVGSRKAQSGDLQAGLVPGDIAHLGDAWPKPSTDLGSPNSCPSLVADLKVRDSPKLPFHPCRSSSGRESRQGPTRGLWARGAQPLPWGHTFPLLPLRGGGDTPAGQLNWAPASQHPVRAETEPCPQAGDKDSAPRSCSIGTGRPVTQREPASTRPRVRTKSSLMATEHSNPPQPAATSVPRRQRGQPRVSSAGSRSSADPSWVAASPELWWWHGVQMFAQLCCDRASQPRKGMPGKAPANSGLDPCGSRLWKARPRGPWGQQTEGQGL